MIYQKFSDFGIGIFYIVLVNAPFLFLNFLGGGWDVVSMLVIYQKFSDFGEYM